MLLPQNSTDYRLLPHNRFKYTANTRSCVVHVIPCINTSRILSYCWLATCYSHKIIDDIQGAF